MEIVHADWFQAGSIPARRASMQNITKTRTRRIVNPAPILKKMRLFELYAMSLMPHFVPTPMRVSKDGKTWWLRDAPVAIEVSCCYDLVIWDKDKEVVIARISVVDAAGQFRGSATIARELKTAVDIFNESYELGRRRGYKKIEIKTYELLIKHEEEQTVLLGVVADDLVDYETHIDDEYYYYWGQSEFDSYNNNLVGVEAEPGTTILEWSGEPDIRIGFVIRE
ncbi:MAG: hypothetical protein WCS42_18055 [Verrucomicrobiota bacterium]